MRTAKFIVVAALSALAFGCGKEKVDEPKKGLEDPKVFKAAQIQVPYNDIHESLRALIAPEIEPFLGADGQNLINELQVNCAITRESNDAVETITVKTGIAGKDCPVSFTATRTELDDSFSQGTSYRIEGSFQANNEDRSVSGIRAIEFVTVIQHVESNTGVLNEIIEKTTGTIENDADEVATFRRLERLKFLVSGANHSVSGSIGMTTTLGATATWDRTWTQLNGAITVLSSKVNSKLVTKAQASKLAGAKIQSW